MQGFSEGPDSRLARLQWVNDEQLVVGDTRFKMLVGSSNWHNETPDEFAVLKSRWMIERFFREAPERVENIVELGIFKGGSALLLQEVFQPRRVVGVDLQEVDREPLERYIAKTGKGDAIRLYYGVDQGDHQALDRIMKENFPDGEIDLVIDDCSHLYGPTKASLNFLLPRLRPLGLYVIEDWGWAHWQGEEWQGPDAQFKDEATALSNLVLELVMTAASRTDIIRELRITSDSVYIIKGWPPTDPEGFDISTSYLTRGRTFPLAL